MIRKLVFLASISLFIFSCSEGSNSSSDHNSSENGENQIFLQEDEYTGLHIAFVEHLPETDEYAMEISFKENKSLDDLYKAIAIGKAKVSYTNDVEYTRYELPDMLVNQMLDTRFLTNVHFFDSNNRDLGKVEILRYEYIERPLNETIAVIVKGDKKLKNAFYGIGGLEERIPEMKLDRSRRKDLIATAVADAKAKMTEMTSEQCGIGDHYFSLVQGWNDANFETTCRIYHTFKDETESVVNWEESEIIMKWQPLSVLYKGKPILLISMGIMWSDAFGDNVFVFDGKKYVPVESWGKVEN